MPSHQEAQGIVESYCGFISKQLHLTGFSIDGRLLLFLFLEKRFSALVARVGAGKWP
jgi:hypothetical protein